jgi:hypothetical protein
MPWITWVDDKKGSKGTNGKGDAFGMDWYNNNPKGKGKFTQDKGKGKGKWQNQYNEQWVKCCTPGCKGKQRKGPNAQTTCYFCGTDFDFDDQRGRKRERDHETGTRSREPTPKADHDTATKLAESLKKQGLAEDKISAALADVGLQMPAPKTSNLETSFQLYSTAKRQTADISKKLEQQKSKLSRLLKEVEESSEFIDTLEGQLCAAQASEAELMNLTACHIGPPRVAVARAELIGSEASKAVQGLTTHIDTILTQGLPDSHEAVAAWRDIAIRF